MRGNDALGVWYKQTDFLQPMPPSTYEQRWDSCTTWASPLTTARPGSFRPLPQLDHCAEVATRGPGCTGLRRASRTVFL